MDGGTNGLHKGTDSTEWTDGVERVARRTDGRTERMDGENRRTEMDWTDRGKDGWTNGRTHRLTKWTLSGWTGLLYFLLNEFLDRCPKIWVISFHFVWENELACQGIAILLVKSATLRYGYISTPHAMVLRSSSATSYWTVEGFVSEGRWGFFFFFRSDNVNIRGFADLAVSGIYSSDSNLLCFVSFYLGVIERLVLTHKCHRHAIRANVNKASKAVSTGILCCNLAESESVLKMCFSKHCHEVTGFLLWIGTYCISCEVQQRSRIKDLFSLVGYDDSCLVAIRHVKSIVRVIKPRPNIRSHSVLL